MEWANSKETVYVGWIGTCIFSVLTILSLLGYYYSPNRLLTRLFFISILLSTSLDLPRYIFQIIDQEYTSTIGYSCHILSNYFFFLSLTLVCVVWAHLLQTTSSSFTVVTTFIYRGQGVLLTNALLAIISILTFIYCMKANSLENFLRSTIYLVYIFIEVLEGLFYSVAVAFFGIKLVLRLSPVLASLPPYLHPSPPLPAPFLSRSDPSLPLSSLPLSPSSFPPVFSISPFPLSYPHPSLLLICPSTFSLLSFPLFLCLCPHL